MALSHQMKLKKLNRNCSRLKFKDSPLSMKIKILKLLLVPALLLTLSQAAYAAFNGDMSINSQDIKFSTTSFLEGRQVRIYATAKNNSAKDLLGVVRFYDNGTQIGGDQAISIFAGNNDGAFIDWNPVAGNHKIAVKIYPWEPNNDDPSNNWIVSEIFVIQDTDHDGIPNKEDTDDDGDGVEDTKDAYPLNGNEQYDSDGDGKGDNSDDDDDGDEVPDKFDEMPLDPNETLDTDKDKIGNIADTDDDGDSITDVDEENTGTDPLNIDTDKDGVNDKDDAFPLDPRETLDTDHDSIGNNMDIDDDNDGIPDKEDKYPLNKAPKALLKDEDPLVGLYENYTFDATPSQDDDGEIVSYDWKIDQDIEKEGNALNIIFNRAGEHNVQLTITDSSGEKTTKNYQVSVINLGLYKQLALTLLIILLALLVYFKYIADTKRGAQRSANK